MAQRIPEKPYQEWIGAGVFDVREAARLTQPQLAVLLKVSKQTVWNIENAGVIAKAETIRLIAEVCAGRGWLPNDPDGIEEYILGMRPSLDLKMEREPRPRLGLVGKNQPEPLDSTSPEEPIPGYINTGRVAA